MAGKAPLHKRVHWRTIRTVIKMLSNYENINYNEYDLESINCRSTFGSVLHGKNVTCDMCDSDRSYFVTDNEYDIFEIPSIKNKKGSMYGNFLILIHNTSFDYWMFGTLRCFIDKKETCVTHNVKEKYFYDLLGHYDIIVSDRVTFTKTLRGDKIAYGHAENDKYYNAFDRKKAYHVSNNDILNNIGVRTAREKLSDNKAVKIYKHRKRKSGRA